MDRRCHEFFPCSRKCPVFSLGRVERLALYSSLRPWQLYLSADLPILPVLLPVFPLWLMLSQRGPEISRFFLEKLWTDINYEIKLLKVCWNLKYSATYAQESLFCFHCNVQPRSGYKFASLNFVATCILASTYTSIGAVGSMLTQKR